MREGMYIVDGDGHVMDFPHRCYQKYLPEQYRRRIAFFPGAQWDRRQAPNGDLGRDPNTPHEMMADMALEGIDLAFLYPTSALRIGEIREAEAERLGVPVGMHASGSETGDPYRFSNFLAVHTWTHAPEQMISLISCVYGGLFEKFQRLRIGFMESGAGWVPFFMEHMDGEFEKRPWDAPLCKAKPSEYMTCGRWSSA